MLVDLPRMSKWRPLTEGFLQYKIFYLSQVFYKQNTEAITLKRRRLPVTIHGRENFNILVIPSRSNNLQNMIVSKRNQLNFNFSKSQMSLSNYQKSSIT